MSAASIRAKVKSGLKKAIAATGSNSSELIYKITYTNTGGSTPLDLPIQSEVLTVLENALFKSYKSKEFNENIRQGDKILVSDNVTAITEGDIVRQGVVDFIVVATDTKAPTSDVLVYISQVRQK